MKYAAIITYTTGERTGATVSANGLEVAWEKVFDLFPKADVRAVELAAILTPDQQYRNDNRNVPPQNPD